MHGVRVEELKVPHQNLFRGLVAHAPGLNNTSLSTGKHNKRQNGCDTLSGAAGTRGGRRGAAAGTQRGGRPMALWRGCAGALPASARLHPHLGAGPGGRRSGAPRP
eukprot:2742705-Rhodomonas_salina.1